jgi:hypothetical protein
MKRTPHPGGARVDGMEIAVFGLFPRLARLRSEHHQYVDDPPTFLASLRDSNVVADIFTFLQPVFDTAPRQDYLLRWDTVAVLTIDTYENWWKRQVNDKTRNMVRKASKKGVIIQQVPFSDELAKGIHIIYNESPLIQGKPSKHYGKDLETLKRAHATFLDQSVFIGAFHEGALIGFIKMILHPNRTSASIMQVISLVAHRDKAPTNALLGKAIETCAERGIRFLQYGVWSRRSLGEFKKHHGFAPVAIPRYFVPLNWRGRIALGLGLHRSLAEFVPGSCQDALASLRAKWYLFKHRSQMQSQGL